jgi:hypothetical protein
MVLNESRDHTFGSGEEPSGQRRTGHIGGNFAPPPLSHWRRTSNAELRIRKCGDEYIAFLNGPEETVVLNKLGAVALEGITAGNCEFQGLEHWCQEHGFAEAGGELVTGLNVLLIQLSELEVITTKQ